MIEAQVPSATSGRILFDRSLGAEPDASWFDAGRSRGDAPRLAGGRGAAIVVDTPVGACVLRHYRRGGFAGRISHDRYLWTGYDRSRPFREFRLLARLAGDGLPVPAPVAARCEPSGLTSRGDLLMRRIPAAQTLAERLAAATLDSALAQRAGHAIARMHSAGVWHADLNAHNILVDAGGKVWLIDFDRGRIRRPSATWRRRNLARLRRSFDKLGAAAADGFDARFWQPLLAAYEAAMRAPGQAAARETAT